MMRSMRKWLWSTLVLAAGLLPVLSFAQTFAYSQILTALGSGVVGTNDPASEPQVIALGNNGQAYLPAWQDTSGTWHTNTHANALLAGQSSPTTFKQLVACKGANWQYLIVVGLAANGSGVYVVAYQDFSGGWVYRGVQLSSGSYSSLAATTGSAGNVDIMGVGASNGEAYLIASQNSKGTWTTYDTAVSTVSVP
jgi:hypothetical protein